MRLVFLLLSILPLLPHPAWAYPNLIGYGYSSCTACHYNPLGNGPLTDYGRALSATVVSSRPFYASKDASDEKLSAQSGFLGSTRLPNWLRPSLDYRGMDIRSGVGSEQSLRRWINMQAEGSLAIKAFDDRAVLVGTVGYVPVPQQVSAERRTMIPTLISREHYLGVRPSKRIGIYLGMMDPAFGIRIPDHNAYMRSRTFNNINDQTHGLLLHYTTKKWDASLHGMMGNLSQSSDLRQLGASGLFEYDVARKWRLGASGWVTASDYRSRQMTAIHSRSGFGEGSALLAQVGTVREDPITEVARTGLYTFTQMTTRMRRGLNLLLTFEYYTADFSAESPRFYRAGPSVQWFPMQRLEFRIDFLGARQTGASTLDPDIYSLQSQVHVWL